MTKEVVGQQIGLTGTARVVEDHSDPRLGSRTPTRHSTDERWEKAMGEKGDGESKFEFFESQMQKQQKARS